MHAHHSRLFLLWVKKIQLCKIYCMPVLGEWKPEQVAIGRTEDLNAKVAKEGTPRSAKENSSSAPFADLLCDLCV
jgi:hypothetical protein